jgi:hypothetical protein
MTDPPQRRRRNFFREGKMILEVSIVFKRNTLITIALAVVILLSSGLCVQAQFSKTHWEMNLGEGIVNWGYETPYHGYEGEYDYATIPNESDAGWGLAPDPEIIDYYVPSTLCDVMDCRCGGDFTYFRTYVNIPSGSTVTEFTISMSGVDDGVRVTIFNSDYPSGIVVPGSYVFLGGTGTADLMGLVKPGETNMVILTHVDDCCSESYLNNANVEINGTIVPTYRPVAVCQEAIVAVGEVPDIDGGSYDPDGDELTFDVSPAGFDLPGIYDATLTVTDPYGLTDSCTAQVVVYDPSGGFVTGGGWFNQPEPIIDDSFNGNYYDLVTAPGISWADADEEASAMTLGVMGEFSGHLVTITSQAEQDFLNGVFGSSLQEKWYGGFQDPDAPNTDANWHWITGESWDYTNWAAGEPNDDDGVEDGKEQYLMGWTDELTWNDGEFGTDGGGYVVEYEGSELLTGKATFGFVATYKKGANAPTGQTEFQFQAGDLNFHSSNYEWLVVTGSNYAKFKGEGTINGAGLYKFQIWAGDSSPDTFRIKIWTEDEVGDETVVYDNGFDQAIGGGSIVIHTK